MYKDVQRLLLRGIPVVVEDGARGLEMAAWDCDYVRKTFPGSTIRHEGGESEINKIKMSSDWTSKKVEVSGRVLVLRDRSWQVRT